MPELPPTSLYFNRSSKSAGLPPVQIRKVLYFSGRSAVVVPVMAPSATVQYSVLPFQPVRSVPLKRLTKPSSADRAGKAASRRTSEPRTASRCRVMRDSSEKLVPSPRPSPPRGEGDSIAALWRLYPRRKRQQVL